MSKHQEIIKYILSLKAGAKISVRSIAHELHVSEGTAYRAIKECENMGAATTIPRIGTVIIEKLEKKSSVKLTYAEVINIIDGTILGGREGIYKTLNKFVIGAMTIDAMEKYILPGNLLIVGNREEAQRLALTHESAVLISGGFECSQEVRNLADEKCLPVISSAYDSFTIASMINRAMSENLIKNDIILVEDIMKSSPNYIKMTDTLKNWKSIIRQAKKNAYPVVDDNKRVIGVITYKDISGSTNDDEKIAKFMSREPITVTPETTAAYAAHVMAWEDIDACPVVNHKRLVGIVKKQDALGALQHVVRQPQVATNIEDLIMKNFNQEPAKNGMHFWGKIIPEMLDSIGIASWGSLNMLITSMALINLREKNRTSISVDSVTTYFMKPVQIDTIIHIYTTIIDSGRNFCKAQIDVYDDNKELISKALMSGKIIRK